MPPSIAANSSPHRNNHDTAPASRAKASGSAIAPRLNVRSRGESNVMHERYVSGGGVDVVRSGVERAKGSRAHHPAGVIHPNPGAGMIVVSARGQESNAMCLVFTLLLLGPRAAIVLYWLGWPARWDAAFGSPVVPIIGFLLLPWATLTYLLVAP